MIEARGLTKRYGDKVAVDNISFTVEPGTVTGFLGPNGAGKTTTIDMILGLSRPTSGDARVFGMSPRQAGGRGPPAFGRGREAIASEEWQGGVLPGCRARRCPKITNRSQLKSPVE